MSSYLLVFHSFCLRIPWYRNIDKSRHLPYTHLQTGKAVYHKPSLSKETFHSVTGAENGSQSKLNIVEYSYPGTKIFFPFNLECRTAFLKKRLHGVIMYNCRFSNALVRVHYIINLGPI